MGNTDNQTLYDTFNDMNYGKLHVHENQMQRDFNGGISYIPLQPQTNSNPHGSTTLPPWNLPVRHQLIGFVFPSNQWRALA